MREMLFKAKSKDDGKWVEGYYVKLIWPAEDFHGIIPENTIMFSDNTVDVIFEIDPETLCQYTGLKDKNDNRIWENDIVSCEHEKFQEGDLAEQYPFPDTIRYKRNYVVEFINTGSSYGYRLRNKSIHFMLTGNVIYNHNIEVLGNVFDNPELLEEVRG